MNPANFQNMAGPPPGLHGNQRPPGPSQNTRVQHLIYRMLLQQQPPQGWQTAVPLEKRTVVVWQLVSSLRLIKPDMDIQQSINVAITFEQKTFGESPDQTTYEQICHQKLKDISETRSKQASKNQQQLQNPQQAQMNMTPQQMQMQGMVQNQNAGHFQPGFPNPQLQHAMQSQQQLSQQPQPQILNPQPVLQPAHNQHPPQPQIAQQTGPPSFTAGEQLEINRMAQIIAQNTPKERLEQIQRQLQSVPPDFRQNLAMQNIDPLTYWFRNQATQRYMAQKAHVAAQRNQINGPPGSGLTPQQSRPTPQNSTPQAAGAPAPQNFDSSQILVQQQNALRSQEAGHMVVPASSQAMVDQQRGNARGTAQQLNGQANGGRPMQNPTQPFYPQPNTQQAHMQSQPSNIGNIPNQSPQHSLQGQPHGLNTPGRTPQPNMPNLNRAFGSPNQQTQAAANMWSQQRAQPHQQKDQHQMNPQQAMQSSGQLERPDASQQRPRSVMMNMPPEVQQRLASMPEEPRNHILAQMQERQRQQMLQRQQAMQENAGKPGSQFMGTQPGQQPPAVVQQPPLGQPNVLPQRPQQQQHPNMNLLDQQRVAQAANIALTDEQARQMDRHNFPSAILNISGALSTLPKDVKTWGQLKNWVAQNQSTLPPGSLNKLRGLQGLHYQNLVGVQRARLLQGQVGLNATGQVLGQGTSQSQAPQAQMVAPPSNPAPLGGPKTPRMQTAAATATLPQPTPQEIQATRTRLPGHLKGLSDDQIRIQILKQRQYDMLKITQGHPGITPQQQAQLNQVQRAQQQPTQQIQFQTPVNPKTQPAPPQTAVQRQQPQPSPRPGAAPKVPAGKQPQAARAVSTTSKQGQPNQKGIKRNSNDDVVEVPNPNLATPLTKAQSSNAIQALQQPRPGIPQNTDAQGQRAQLEAQLQIAATMHQATGPMPAQPQNQGVKSNGQANSGSQPKTEEQMRKEAQLQQIYVEVARSTPRGNLVAMAPQTRQRMVQMLGENTKLMSSIPNALPIFFSLITEEPKLRDLIRTHLLASYQYRDKTYSNPADHFTISIEELDAAVKKLNHWFGWMVEQINARKVNQGIQILGTSQNQPPPQRPQPQPQPAKEPMPVLNAANLQQQQLALRHARAANLQKNHGNTGVAMQKTPSNNSTRTPAAPTSTHAPFSFGGQPPQPPHGVPRAYADRPNELTQEKLVIPPNAKRRKGNQVPSASSTPVLAQRTPVAKPSPQITKVESPGIQRQPPASIMLKCSDPDCAMSAEEFATQADLDAHKQRIHPNFTDPLDFCLESIRMGLNLDEDGKSKPRPEAANADGGNSSESPDMKKSASVQDQAPIKQESATPMTRVPTQTGPSPASNLLKTPQATSVKTPASESKPASKDGKLADAKASQSTPKTPAPTPEDPWAGSDVAPSVIISAFSGLADLNILGPWTKAQNTLTPDSTLSSGNTEKNSPRPSDISENDAVNISINVDDSNWMPSEWFTDSGMEGFGALHVGAPELEDIDWGFGDEEEADTGNGKGKKKEKSEDECAPSREWLKVWAPERLPKD